MGYKDVARACQEYIDVNLDKELTLESIANALSFSTIYLRKSFQKVSNVTVGKYIQNARLSRAAHDLIHGLCIVSEAAQISGFSSIYSFSKTFCKVLGVPPIQIQGRRGSANHQDQAPDHRGGLYPAPRRGRTQRPCALARLRLLCVQSG